MTEEARPPRIAVALHYDGESAPRVTAKGTGATAERIMELARRHDVPLQPDPELTEMLSRIPLGEEIPRELFVAVAEVIAFAYLLRGKQP